MITAILLSCFTITVSPVPVSPNVLPSLRSPQPVEATDQKPEAQTLAPRSPCMDQPQPVVPQLQNPQHGYQFLSPVQHYAWPPIGGSPLLVPLQQGVQGSQPASQPTLQQSHQQPLVFAPYGFFPLFSSPYGNQQSSPYGFPTASEPPLPQTPANQPSNAQVSPVEKPSGPVPSTDARQPTQQQQQQNPQIVYMLQQPMNSRLGGLSSEELAMAAKLGQMGVYMQTVPASAIQPNPGKLEALPSEGTSLPGAKQT